MKARSGTVYLVGAGPGDPGLITVRGRELLSTCDVVLYDRLVARELLDHARADAELVFVGKKPGETHSRQVVADALLVGRARDGKSVVRLKGGDPFVFGRGGEEASLLVSAGIPFEVVPGVSSAIAAPAYAGIPVTHRGASGSFAVITARGEGEPAHHWSSLAVAADTLVLLMGVSALASVTRSLIEGGLDPATPAAVIEWGTMPRQRAIVADVASIAERAHGAGLAAPATTVIGKVVELRDTISWFESRPLLGRRVVVTRAREQSRELTDALLELGAEVVNLPVIAIEDPPTWHEVDRAIDELAGGSYEWALFSSVNSVERFLTRLAARGHDARSFARCKVAAVGDATARSLSRHGLHADLVPDEFVSGAVVEALGAGSGRILAPRVLGAPRDFADRLEAAGWHVDQVDTYANVRPPVDPQTAELVRSGEIDALTFTSASTVTGFVEVVGKPGELDAAALEVVCIGPKAAAAAREVGFEDVVVADPHSTAGMVDALLRALVT